MLDVHAPDPIRPDPLTVVVVDADDLVRENLAGLLGIGDRLQVVGSAGGADSAIRLILDVHPDIVVVDPRMPDLASGLAFIGQVKSVEPGACVLVIGSSDVIEQAALSEGVDGCTRKTYRPDDLTAAILLARRRQLD